jgi:hypothetical protein
MTAFFLNSYPPAINDHHLILHCKRAQSSNGTKSFSKSLGLISQRNYAVSLEETGRNGTSKCVNSGTDSFRVGSKWAKTREKALMTTITTIIHGAYNQTCQHEKHCLQWALTTSRQTQCCETAGDDSIYNQSLIRMWLIGHGYRVLFKHSRTGTNLYVLQHMACVMENKRHQIVA